MQTGNHVSSTSDTPFRSLADHAPCVVWASDPAGGWRYVNPAWHKLTGQPVEQACGAQWLQRIPDEDRLKIKAAFLNAAQTTDGFELDHSIWTAEAGVQAVTLKAFPDVQQGRLIGFTGYCSFNARTPSPNSDQRALFRNQREVETLVENSPDVIARVGRDLRHLYVNRAVVDAFGIDPTRVIGHTIAELGFPAQVAASYDRAATEVFESGEERAFNFSIDTPDSRTHHYTTRVLPEFDHRRQVESVLSVTYDVTQRTEAQLERDALLLREQAARQQAEASARARDQFLSIVSHELRSPLNGIQSWAHVLENRVGADSPAIARAISGIKTGVQQQVRMIEELLDTTRVMTGKLKLSKAPFVLDTAVNAAVARVENLASAREIMIDVQLPATAVHLVGSADRVEQIIWNLLTNAIKFSPPASRVTVAVELGDIDVRISVKDEGKGIATDFLPFMFDAFRQADSSNTRKAEGLGLGLTLVRHLTELHGGRATASSPGEQQGSTFSVFLPLRSGLDAEDDGPPAILGSSPASYSLDRLDGIRILLVDDQKEARDSLSELLGQGGAQVTSAASGEQAIAFLKQCSRDDAPQVIICDIAMPVQDGYSTMQQVRQLERHVSTQFRGPIPAIALTAFAQREDRERALGSGFQVYLTKPANPAQLVSTIASLVVPACGADDPIETAQSAN